MNIHRSVTLFFFPVLAALLCLSTSWYAWNQSKQTLRDKTLEQARIVATSIDTERLLSIKGSLNTPHAHVADSCHIKRQLAKIEEILLGCKFSYVLGVKKDKTVYYLADSHQQLSPTNLISHEICENIPSEYLSVFANKTDYLMDPIIDSEDTVMTILVPISDETSDEVIGVLGMDIQRAGWPSLLISQAFITPSLTLSILLLFFVLQKMNRNHRVVEQQCSEKTALSLELYETNQQLVKLSNTDPLTSLCNRFSLDVSFEREIKRYERYSNLFSVILIDIDFFKSINDQFGHCKGDDVLIQFSQLISKFSRSNDIIGRWGGEEFIILCPETTAEGATLLAEKLRIEIERYDFNIKRVLTASFGIAAYSEQDTKESLVRKVDVALYQAKKTTRNCVVTAPCLPQVDMDNLGGSIRS